MNLIHESLLRYEGLNGYDGVCHIRMLERPSERPVVIAGNLDDSPGTTITNAIEMVAEAVKRQVVTDGREFELIEHYPVAYLRTPIFSWVRFERRYGRKGVLRKGVFHVPRWEPIQGINAQLGCEIKIWPEGEYTARAIAGGEGESLREKTREHVSSVPAVVLRDRGRSTELRHQRVVAGSP